MSLKQYFNSVVSNPPLEFANGWGWFVDMESGLPKHLNKKIYLRSGLPTIKERSRSNSIYNLFSLTINDHDDYHDDNNHDDNNHDDDDNNHDNDNYYSSFYKNIIIYINLCCCISFLFFYYNYYS
jgi:hypothetical protein